MSARADSRLPPPSVRAAYFPTGHAMLGREIDGKQWMCETYHAYPTRPGTAGNAWRIKRDVAPPAAGPAAEPMQWQQQQQHPVEVDGYDSGAVPPDVLAAIGDLRGHSQRLGEPIPDEETLTLALENYGVEPDYLYTTLKRVTQLFAAAVEARLHAAHALACVAARRRPDGEWRSTASLLKWLPTMDAAHIVR